MSIVRYEELDQITGELLPERTLLGVVRFASGGYGVGGYSGTMYYHPENQDCQPFASAGEATAGQSGLIGNLLSGISLITFQNQECKFGPYSN